MSFGILLLLIALAWLSYPFAGAARVTADKIEGKRTPGEGFSCLPELIIFPLVSLGLAYLIDWVAMPYGQWIIGSLSLLLFLVHCFVILKSIRRITLAKKRAIK